MTLQEAYIFFESLAEQTTHKAEEKLYERFMYLLVALKNRDFSNDELQSIEAEIDNLNLTANPENNFKYYKRTLAKFEKYLKDTFSLSPKSFYTNMGISLGSLFGILFGIVFLSNLERSSGIALGLTFGMLFGLILGRSLDNKVKKEGRMI